MNKITLSFVDKNKNKNKNDFNLFNNSNKKIIYNNEGGKFFWEYDEKPTTWVSILVASYNTCLKYLYDCVISIKKQIGHFGIELVWINDCSNDTKTQILLAILAELNGLRNFRLIYNKTKINRGLSFCLHEGLLLCTNEIVFRMDSDDIMLNKRIQTQINFMNNNPNCVLCGSNIISFINDKNEISRSNHPYLLTWEEYKNIKSDWILNHPTLCFKKTAILNIGNYRENFKLPFEDLDLELRVLKKYGILHNISECLVLYRQHEKQTSIKLGKGSTTKQLIELYIDKMIKN